MNDVPTWNGAAFLAVFAMFGWVMLWQIGQSVPAVMQTEARFVTFAGLVLVTLCWFFPLVLF